MSDKTTNLTELYIPSTELEGKEFNESGCNKLIICKVDKGYKSIPMIKYLSEEYFNSIIEKWKEEENIWKQELEEKDKEIERLSKIVKPINKKQTAVKWLEEIYLTTGIDRNFHFNQAKAMEKEQMDKISEDWWVEGCAYMKDGKRIYQSFEQYYKETYE